MNQSNSFIESLCKDGVTDSDIVLCCIMFGKFFEIIGQLTSQSINVIKRETKYQDIEALIDDLKEFNKVINQNSINEQLKELYKAKVDYSKKKTSYEKAVKSTEEAITKTKLARNDPTLAYEYGVREDIQDRANKSIKDLDNKKHCLQACIEDLNLKKETVVNLMDRNREKTKWAIEEYINLLIETLNTDAKFHDDHFRGIELLSSEKNKHFRNAQRLKEYHTKRNIPLAKLKDLKEKLMSFKSIHNKKVKT